MTSFQDFANLSGSKKDWIYSYHAVAFLDLMGQRKCFDGISGVPKSEEEKARVIEALKKSIGFIAKFRAGFQNLFKSIQSVREIPSQVPIKFHDEYRKMQQTEIHLQSVSDAVVVWSPILTRDEPGIAKAMNNLWGILMAAAGMNLLSLASHHPLRGGIDVEGAITLDSGGIEIYGPALNSAYELESKIAQSPRILIGNGLLRFIASIESDKSSSRYCLYAKTLAKQCRAFIVQDEDNRLILHFLGAASKELMLQTQAGTGDYKKDVLYPAYSFVKASVETYRSDAILGPRYQHLLRYFEKYLPNW